MKKYLITLLAVALMSAASYAETDYVALPKIRDIQKGVDNANQIQDLRVQDDATIGDDADIGGDATIGGDADIGGDANVSGSMQVSGLYRDVPTALSVTNGQSVTVAEQSYLVSGIGSPNDNTNTVTLADPGTALLGLTVRFTTASTSTNLFGLADSGNLKLNSAWVGDNYDSIMLYAAETNAWVQLGDN